MAAWPGGFIDQRLIGNFSMDGKAEWRSASKRKSLTMDENALDSGMEIGEGRLNSGKCQGF
jgi:hypothetical protein